MSEPADLPPLESPVPSEPGNEARLGAHSLKRRRLIKLGASAASVTLTLSSRPVRAWECNSTSAWGSAQLNPNRSTTARNTAHQVADECWSITEWVNNSSHGSLGQPWPYLNCTNSTLIANYTVGTLYQPYGGTPTGLTSSNKLMDKLKNGTNFQKYMLVARLNSKIVPNVQSCLRNNATDQLVLMAGGTYSPPNLPGVVWNQSQIIQYLGSNYIVMP
jgi:hypothetical protein